MTRSRWGLVLAGIVVFLLVAGQILLPSFGERAIEDRLTANGGSADVTLGAVPAFRLFFGDGERFDVRARELELELDPEEPVLERLDGFASVNVSIADSQAGPIELESFEFAPRSLRSVSAHGGGAGVRHLADRLRGRGHRSSRPWRDRGRGDGPVRDRHRLHRSHRLRHAAGERGRSSAGRVGRRPVGGVPTGPLAELITNAVVIKL